MKNSLNYLVKLILLLVLIAFTGCEKDLYEDGLQNSPSEMNVREISLKDIEKSVSTKINNEINKVKQMKYKTTSEGNRIEYNSELGIYIDKDNGNLVSVDGKNFYTFPMFSDEDNKIENVLFVDKGTGEMDTYLIKYDITPQEFENLTAEQVQNIDAEYQKVFWSGGEQVCFTWTTTTTVYPNCPYPDGLHSNGVQCDAEIHVNSTTLCTFVEVFGQGDSLGDNGGGDGVGGDTSGGGTTGGSSSGNTIHTGIGTSPELQKSKRFDKQLTNQQKNCLSNLTADQKTTILDFSSFNPIVNCNGSTLSEEEEFNLREEILNETCNSSPSPEPEYNDSNYPGKEDGMPYQWWLDQNYIKNNLKISKDSNSTVLEEPNAREILLFAMYPFQALIHVKNSNLALTKAQELVAAGTLTHIHNGRADAYRHAFWNARDTADFGSFFTKLFTDAHEWNSCDNTLECAMDLFNNQKGRTLGLPYNVFTFDSEISNIIITALYTGNLLYLSPLTDEGNILPTTQIIPTN